MFSVPGKGSGGERVIVVSPDPEAVDGQGLGKFLQCGNPRGFSSGDPVFRVGRGRGFVGLLPELPQVFLHTTGQGQRFVEPESLLPALEKVEARWDLSRSCRSLVVRFRVRAMSPKPR